MRVKSTEIMKQILDFAKEFIRENGRSPYVREIADSLASLVATGSDYVEDPEKLKTPMALTAILLNKVVKSSQLDMTKPLRVINGEDVSLTNENDKEVAMTLANRCERLQRGSLLTKKHPAVLKKEEVTEEVPDLTAKRPYQPEI